MSTHLFCNRLNKLPFVTPDHKIIGNKISIWIIDTDLYLSRLAIFRNILTPGEQKHADRFYRENDRINFTIRRAVLRLLLAAESACQPHEISFLTGVNGKPRLAAAGEIHFNSSHSESFAAIAIAHQHIGIDLEMVKNDFDYASVAEYAFSEKEADSLQCSSDPVRDFFSIWTRKEAFLKATGTGLGKDIHLLNCLEGKQAIPASLAVEKTDWESYTVQITKAYLLSVTAKKASVPFNMEFMEFDESLLPAAD